MISLLFISCISKEIIAVQNADSMLSDMVIVKQDVRIQSTQLTNEEIVNTIMNDVKWSETTLNDGTKYIYATGKYIDIEQAKRNAYLTQLFIMVLNSKNGIDWDKVDPIMYVKYIIGVKKDIDDYFLLGDTSKGTFLFNESGEIIQHKEEALYFNFLTFIGYDISLNGIDKLLELPTIDNY